MEFLAHIWKNYLIHAADILLVAYLIYHILLIIQGTRAVQVLRGLVVLAVGTFLVEKIFKLPTLGWILDTFWLAWAVILAVVFQPELRSLLAQLGSQKLSRLLIPGRFNFVDEIVAALAEASKNKTGMLLVLEQETGLRNYIETGTVVNGEVSSDLLLTIFHPKTLLHDGAAILREDRLLAAGCVLPLSNDPGLARVLGTRHRAAMGITEVSDAVVLVVSEESGGVSLARNGRLERDVDPEELRKRLLEFYKSMSERGLIRQTGART